MQGPLLRNSILALALIVLGGCAHQGRRAFAPEAGRQAAVDAALEEARGHRVALEHVLAHYHAGEDSLALAAACFLIANMGKHGYARFHLADSAGTQIDFDVLDYPDYEALRAALDAREAVLGELHYEREEIRRDLALIPPSLLIENIDLALRAWRQKPWARHLTFEEFCAYVLPYRGSNEPLESWRPYFLRRYARLAEQMHDPSDPIEAARLINRDLQGWFRFDPRFYRHPTDQGLAEMLANRMGRCEDMTNLAIYAMRANGLAVTSDYTPFWANTGNNHAWNAIFDREGRVIAFMGAEAHPGEYKLANRAAKAYRKTFACQPENLAFIKHEEEAVPRWLAGRNYLDVTRAYQPVTDPTLPLEAPIPDSVEFAYLCVFNTGEWEAIHWGRIAEGMATFSDMGRGIVYLPAYYLEEELQPAGPAFLLDDQGQRHPLHPRPEAPMTLTLTGTTTRAQARSSESIRLAPLSAGQEYELYYWDDAWISAGTRVADAGPLAFHDVPDGALYWLVATDGRQEERVFTYAGDSQTWW